MDTAFPYVLAILIAPLGVIGGFLPIGLPILVIEWVLSMRAPEPYRPPSDWPTFLMDLFVGTVGIAIVVGCVMLGFTPLITARSLAQQAPDHAETLAQVRMVGAAVGLAALAAWLFLRHRQIDPVTKALRRASGPLPVIVAFGVFDGSDPRSNLFTHALADRRVRALWDRFEWRVPVDYGKHEQVVRRFRCQRDDLQPQLMFLGRDRRRVRIKKRSLFVAPEITTPDQLCALLQAVLARYGA